MTEQTQPKKWNPDCPICNRPKERSEKYDAYFCKYCNIWLEGVCGNRNCEFCASRPRNPIPLNLIFNEKVEVKQGVMKITKKKRANRA